MIHHLSLPAENTRHVAGVLAEILDGKATTLFPDTDTYVAWVGDDFGTCVEIYPDNMSMRPGSDGKSVEFVTEGDGPEFLATHAAISAPRSTAELIEIAEREGWTAREFNRGPFRVVEFWIENRVLIEFFTPEMADEYMSAVRGFLGQDNW